VHSVLHGDKHHGRYALHSALPLYGPHFRVQPTATKMGQLLPFPIGCQQKVKKFSASGSEPPDLMTKSSAPLDPAGDSAPIFPL